MKRISFMLIKWIRHITIQKRLNICLFLIIFIPMFSICVFAYHKTFHDSKEKISFFSSEIIMKASENIQQMVESLENNSIDIAYNDILQDTLLRYDTLSEFERFQREIEMTNICTKKFIQNSIVTDVLALTSRQEPLRCYGDTSFRLRPSLLSLQQIEAKMQTLQVSSVYYPVNQFFEQRISPGINYNRGDGFALCREIKQPEDGKKIGTLIMRIDDKQLQYKYINLNLGNGSEFMIVNADGQIISSSIGEAPGTLRSEFLLEYGVNTLAGTKTLSFDGKDYLGVFHPIEGTDWTLWGLIPYEYINDSSQKMGLSILGIGLICTGLAFFIAGVLSKSVKQPLKKLDKAMESVVIGGFDDSKLWDNAPDELGKLSRKFVHMTRELETQVQRLIEEERQKRAFEIQALQRQVNPHFMSNTLNTIAYLARIQGAENIEKVTLALINLMLASSGKDGSLITVDQEVSYIKDYLYIQDFRFGNIVEVGYQIAPEIRRALIPCFLLQPIVENALLHGIRDMKVGGRLLIEGNRREDTLLFSVTDNGIGMSTEQIQKALYEGPDDSSSHFSAIGIRNINDRIRLLFGDDYGLSIESVVGQMTRVQVKLPWIQQEEKNEEDTDCG